MSHSLLVATWDGQIPVEFWCVEERSGQAGASRIRFWTGSEFVPGTPEEDGWCIYRVGLLARNPSCLVPRPP